MAAELYIHEVEASPLHGSPAEVIEEGDFVTTLPGGEVKPADLAAGDSVDGVVPRRERGDILRENPYDYGPEQYDPDEDFVPFYQLEDASVITKMAIEAGEQLEMFEEVALGVGDDGEVYAFKPSNAKAATDVVGKVLEAAGKDEPIRIRVGL